MIPQALEAKLITALTAALPATAPKSQILGVWQPSTAGEVKNVEDADTVAVLAVALSTFSRETFSAPTGSFNGALTLIVRLDRDATGAALVTFADTIETLFATWQGATYQQTFTALDVPGFSVGNISVNGAQPPILDRAAGTVTVTWSFTISGTEVPVAPAPATSPAPTSSPAPSSSCGEALTPADPSSSSGEALQADAVSEI